MEKKGQFIVKKNDESCVRCTKDIDINCIKLPEGFFVNQKIYCKLIFKKDK